MGSFIYAVSRESTIDSRDESWILRTTPAEGWKNDVNWTETDVNWICFSFERMWLNGWHVCERAIKPQIFVVILEKLWNLKVLLLLVKNVWILYFL